jgi:hypothetical protein
VCEQGAGVRRILSLVLLVMALAPCHMSTAADAPQYPWVRPDGSVDHQKLPRRPQPGDKLGYPKEQSAQMLPPDIRAFLDGVLQLYSVNGLFLDASRTYELLGTQPTRMEMLRDEGRIVGYTVKLGPSGVFARPQWHGSRVYARPYPDPSVDCVDSRAVEGYLDLYLEPVLNTVPPMPPERWDRHGVFGHVYARSISPNTPGVALFFSSGCLSGIDLRMPISHEEHVRP